MKKQIAMDFLHLCLVVLVMAVCICMAPSKKDDFYQAGQLPPNLQSWAGVEDTGMEES